MALILSNLLRTTAITPVSLGGTGVTSITGLVKGNSTAAFTAAQSGVDYIAPSDGLGTPAGGNLSACTDAVAYGIKTSSTTISLSTAIAPTDGQILTATSASTAIWKTPALGTVTSVSALSIGNSGTDISSSVINSSSTPAITLNIPTASSTARGVLSTSDWINFNSKLSAVPTASDTVLGGIKVGAGLAINGSGVLSATYTYILPTASNTVKGGVMIDNSTITINNGVISVNASLISAATTTTLGAVLIPAVATSGITNTSGTIGIAVATNTQLGGVKVDNTSITISNGTISATPYTLPTASNTILGGVKVDNSTITINNGIISVVSSFTTGLSIGTSLTIPSGDTASRPTATQGNLRFNTSLGKFEGYYGSAWGAVGGGLSPTAVQTANGYIAKANDLVRCNTTSGAFSITLPSAPVDGDIIGVVDTHKKFALNNLTILVAGSKTIEDDPTSLVLDIDGSYIALVYNDVNSNWRILETPLGTGISSTTIITSNGYVASVNDLVRCDTTAAAFSVTLPTNPIDGSIVNFVDVASAGSFFTNNLTVLPGSGNTIQNTTSLVLNVNGTYVSLVYNLSTTNWKLLQLSLPTASTTVLGGVKVDGTTITVNGSGVISSSGGGGASATKTISNKTAAYTVVAGDLGSIINCTSGTFTVSLTAAASLGSGFTCTIWNTGTGAITIDPNAAETIDGYTTWILRSGEGLAVVCNGTKWLTDDKKPMCGYAENSVTDARPIASGSQAISIGAASTASGNYSLALGALTTASGANAVAIGNTTTTAGANYSTAIGLNSTPTGSVTATGAGAMALGGSYASGVDSFAAAIGNNTSSYGAQGTNSIAIGYQAKSSAGPFGGASISIGYQTISRDISISIGYQNTATQYQSMALGWFSTVTGSSGISIGNNHTVTASNSTAFGANAVVNESGKFVFGPSSTFANAGDHQVGKMIIRTNTASAVGIVLNADGFYGVAGARTMLIVMNNQAMAFTGTLLAKQSASANIASYIFKGAIVNNGGTVTISTIAIETIIDTIGLTTQPTFTADNTEKGLKVTSGGKASTNIRWVCNIDTTELTYA